MTQTPISSGLISRITQSARYIISGVTPETWFGPLQPLQPIAPPEVAGRRFDYPTGYNLNYTPRSAEAVTFEELRALADNCDILRSVIETRKDQIEAQEWVVRVKGSDTSAKISPPTDDQKRRIDAIMTFLQSPDKEHGFDGWLRQILEDMFVIDGVALYKRRNRAGGLYALEVMDAATIKLLLDDSGRLPAAPDPAYQQILKGVPAADYTREELMYLVHNPRSHKVYGYSHVEQVLITVNILIRRSLHQLEYYREGSTPDALVGLPREWTLSQIADFQKHFDAMLSGNLGQRRHVRFMPGDFKYQETKPPLLKDAYDEFLSRIICFVFSISPEPFVGQVNRATAETSHARATDEGLAPLMRFVRGLIDRIIACEFASPDLEFAWSETRAQDPGQAAQIDVAYVGAGILTPDEVRANMGLAPLAQAQKPVAAPVKKKSSSRLRKDDSGDDDDDSEDDSDDDSGDASDDSGDSDFDDKHPRWPAGTAGGIGGEFAPKDSGDATAALHGALADDASANTSSADGSIPSDTAQPNILDTWGNPNTLQEHVEDHASDFGIDPLDPNAPETYANQANEFLQRSFDDGLPTKIEDQGYIRIYDPESNIFGSYNPDGTTRTYFSPPAGQAYFDQQPGTLYIDGKPVDSVPQASTVTHPSVNPANVTGELNPTTLMEDPIIIEEPIIIP